MTRKLILAALVLFSFSAFSQNESSILLKSDIKSLPKVKSPAGTVLIQPIVVDKKQWERVDDTIEVSNHPADKYYVDLTKTVEFAKKMDSVLAIEHSHVKLYLPVESYKSPKDYLQPFFIKTNEVTNLEYREFLADNIKHKKALYPDTLCWETDFMQAYVGPLQTVYFSHPTYNHYPVVGVSYYQAVSYCKWLQKELNEGKTPEGYTWEVDLPNQYEWAFANGDRYIVRGRTMSNRNHTYLPLSQKHFDHSYITNLSLTDDTTGRIMHVNLNPGYANVNIGSYMNDGYLFTTNTQKSKRPRFESMVHDDDVNEVRFLNTNVSEWCKESYHENWKHVYEYRQKVLRAEGSDGAKLLADLEKFYNEFNYKRGRLVKGGNWYFEQHAFRDGVHVGTDDNKVFLNPTSKHSTVGFRYVVRLVPLPTNEHASN